MFGGKFRGEGVVVLQLFSSRVVFLVATLRLFLSRDTSEMCHHFVLMITTKTTQPRRQVFSVNCSIIGQFCCPIDDIFHISQIPLTLVMNYALDLSNEKRRNILNE